MVELTAEQCMAVEHHPEGVECRDTTTRRTYVLMDAELHRKAMRALQEQEDIAAIRRGIKDMESERTMSIDESQSRLLKRLQPADQ